MIGEATVTTPTRVLLDVTNELCSSLVADMPKVIRIFTDLLSCAALPFRGFVLMFGITAAYPHQTITLFSGTNVLIPIEFNVQVCVSCDGDGQ